MPRTGPADSSATETTARPVAKQVTRRHIHVYGAVQGVGFRPFLYRLAQAHGLSGWVRNCRDKVEAELEGAWDRIDSFLAQMCSQAPAASRIDRVICTKIPSRHDHGFHILDSDASGATTGSILPDLAICDDCLRELRDPDDRRFEHPFINCTNCGPRYTIIDGAPYDRPRTTMRRFTMCRACRDEYDDPTNRRFHAQPIACKACGPKVRLLDAHAEPVTCANPIREAGLLLAKGFIVSVKGLGGYHLAADASSEVAVAELRRRKHRDEKAFAVMARNIDAVRTACTIGPEEASLLQSAARPIVLLRRRDAIPIADGVAPGRGELGVMLPYTPLHHLLMDAFAKQSGIGFLVMTSGNVSDEPIVFEDHEVTTRLADIADAYLVHDREIRTRCDDSVVRVVGNRTVIHRRARGYVPEPLAVGFDFPQPVLAVGGHLKNTFCLGTDRRVTLSHHIGDLESCAVLDSFSDGISRLQQLCGVSPHVIAHDLHPGYLSTQYAQRHPRLVLEGVQHHHAHVASVMAEHGLDGRVIGVAFDGTGLGLDGHLWGGEFLVADLRGFERAAHLQYIDLPGGEKAIRQPWRQALAWLHRLFGDDADRIESPIAARIASREGRAIRGMIRSQVNCPKTCGAGRLFDAVAALLTDRHEVTFEGQAAMELECLAAGVDDPASYPFRIEPTTPALITMEPLFRALLDNLKAGVGPAIIARRFHNTLVEITDSVCRSVRDTTGLDRVALSGGVFQNALLLSDTIGRLSSAGFVVYINQKVPANDGGLCLGQAAVAAVRLRDRTCA